MLYENMSCCLPLWCRYMYKSFQSVMSQYVNVFLKSGKRKQAKCRYASKEVVDCVVMAASDDVKGYLLQY